METIFTYGTLKRGERWHKHKLEEAEFIGEGTLEGYDMYLKYNYPAIIEGSGTVQGELFKVESLDAIDSLEGYHEDGREESCMYLRRKKEIQVGDQTIEAWVYIYNRSIEDLPEIPGGVFCEEEIEEKVS